MSPLTVTLPGYRPRTRPYRKVVVALFLAGMATFTLLYATQALLPTLAGHFHISATSSTWSMSATMLGLAAALLAAGPVSERIGRTPLIHGSLLVSSLIGLSCAFAPTWPVLLGLRTLEGVALAGLPAVATAYLREELHPNSHARAVGLYIGGTALGGMTGRLLTGLVAETHGWRWGLAAAAILSAACALAVKLLLPASRHFTPSTTRTGTGTTAGPPPSNVSAVVRRTIASVSDRALLALLLTGGCSIGIISVVFNTVGFRLENAPFHLSLAAVSLIFCVWPVGSISSAVSGRLADHYGRRAVLPFGCLIALTGIALTLPANLPIIVVGLALIIAGFFTIHGVASSWVPARAHAAGRGTAQAASLYLFTYYLGASTFGTLGAHVWTRTGWNGVALLGIALIGAVAALALLLRRTHSLLAP